MVGAALVSRTSSGVPSERSRPFLWPFLTSLGQGTPTFSSPLAQGLFTPFLLPLEGNRAHVQTQLLLMAQSSHRPTPAAHLKVC